MRKLYLVVGALLVLAALAGGSAWWSLRSVDAKAELERAPPRAEDLARGVLGGALRRALAPAE